MRREPRYESILTRGYRTPRQGQTLKPDAVGCAYVYDHWCDRIVFRLCTEDRRRGSMNWRLPDLIAEADAKADALNALHSYRNRSGIRSAGLSRRVRPAAFQ